MKRFICVLLAIIIVLCAAGCSAGYMPNYTPQKPQLQEEYVDGEQYSSDKLIENKFVNTADENISTFSADIDTASYAYFRKLVQNGYTFSELKATAGNTIRTEELVNYFDYSYKEPVNGELFGVTSQASVCPYNKDAVLLTVGLQTEKAAVKMKNNLVFLIDTSGSMFSEDKLDLLKDAFSYLVGNLSSDDTVSVVTYAGYETVLLDGVSGAKGDMINKAIKGLKADGSTNGEAGILRAYQLAEAHFIPDGNNRIILASDGDLNVGISSESELEALVSDKKNSGVFLSVLGFGTGNYRDGIMETIADKGNGIYYYIDGKDEAEKVFGTDLLSTLYTVAKDVKLQLTFSTEAVMSYRLVGYENRVLHNEDFENDTKDAGELGAGHGITVCYELILNDGAKGIDEWMKLAVRYKAPDGDKSELNEYAIGKGSYTDEPDDDFNFISSVIQLAMLLHDSEYGEGITLDGIYDSVASLQTEDIYKQQFVKLIKELK